MLCYRCGSYTPDDSRKCVVCLEVFPAERLANRLHMLTHVTTVAGGRLIPPFEPNQVLKQRYKILAPLGCGASGWVMQSLDQKTNTEVALKFISANLLQTRLDLKCLRQALSNTQKISRFIPEFITIKDRYLDQEVPFYSMPLNKGNHLGKVIELRKEKGETFNLGETLAILRPISNSLTVLALRKLGGIKAHAALRPHNIILSLEQASVKFTGLAHYHGLPPRPFVELQILHHTMAYLAPEVRRAEEARYISPAADVYSLGVMVSEMLTGQIYTRRNESWFRALAQLTPALSEALKRSVADDLRMRFKTPRELYEVLYHILEVSRVSKRSKLLPTSERALPVDNLADLNALSSEVSAVSSKMIKFSFLGRLGQNISLGISDSLNNFSDLLRYQWKRCQEDGFRLIFVTLLLSIFLFFVGGISTWCIRTYQKKQVINVAIELPPPSGDLHHGGNLEDYEHHTFSWLSPAANGSASAPAPEGGQVNCPAGMIAIRDTEAIVGSNDPKFRQEFGAEPVRTVTIAPYCIDIYEYPNREGAYPITSVNFEVASMLCAQENKRLCNEFEWEHACSGKYGKQFSFSDKAGDSYRSGWCNIGTLDDALKKAPSGAFKRCLSAYGVMDMSGNVAEWTSSSWSLENTNKVVRGGSVNQPHMHAHCSARSSEKPGTINDNLGFRCCQDLKD